MPTETKFPLDRFAEIESCPENFRLLERVPVTRVDCNFPYQVNTPVGDEAPLVLLDTETTGLVSSEESLIELGLVLISYSPSLKRVTEIVDFVSQYDDPGKPIPEVITNLTGISSDMVSGQRIDETIIADLLEGDPLLVAHNSNFDRPFFEQRLPHHAHYAWGCSLSEIDWKGMGYESRKLEHLLIREGYFYEGHRASIDCLALAWLLTLNDEFLSQIISNSEKVTVLIQAFGTPFEVKDRLKERGYAWHDGKSGANKHWWIEVDETNLIDEQNFLDEIVHRGSEQANYRYISARERYKLK